MGILALILLFLRSVFGVFALAAIPWVFVEVVSIFFRPKDLWHSFMYSAVLAFVAVVMYKAYIISSSYPCPPYQLPDVEVENCGISAVLALLPENFAHVFLGWLLSIIFIAVGFVTYVYIPEDVNIHLRRYLATVAAVAVAVAWVVIFPWSVPLLLGL